MRKKKLSTWSYILIKTIFQEYKERKTFSDKQETLTKGNFKIHQVEERIQMGSVRCKMK